MQTSKTAARPQGGGVFPFFSLIQNGTEYSSRSPGSAIVSLQIETSQVEGEILLVKLSGSITRWGQRYTDEPLIEDLLHQGDKKLILDLSGIDEMDGSGVQLLYECFSAVRRAGGELRFVGANARVARLFQITHAGWRDVTD
jgi:anti-sigma B factor antagonist